MVLADELSLLLSQFAETASQGATLYAFHSGDRIAGPEDFKRAMMMEALVYAKRGVIVDQLENIQRDLNEPGPLAGRRLCRWFNAGYEEWDKWTPETPLEKGVKDAITVLPEGETSLR